MFDIFKRTVDVVETTAPESPTTAALKASFTGPTDRAGLLFTAELDKAIEECKAEVARIVEDCRRHNRKFRDIEFDLDNDRQRCLRGLNRRDDSGREPEDVRRVTQIFDNPHFFIDGAGADDIYQGQIGDCWFLSALATMSAAKGLVEKCCVARDEQVGVYGFIFFRDVKWVTVIIDDLLFTGIPKFENLSWAEQMLYHNDRDRYASAARKGGKTLLFAKTEDTEETWVPLIEKAYAKLHGDYASIDGGWTAEGVEDMTGGVGTFIKSKDILDRDAFWTNELVNANKDRLFGGSFFGNMVDGIYGGHAYSVLRAIEYNGKRFVLVRNPWGKSEWTGRWSDGSKEWNTEWLAALPAIGHKFGDDGQFLMEYSDFLETFDDIDRVRLFDSSWRMSTQWLKTTARPPPSAWSYGDISFTIFIPAPCSTVIVLSQLDERFFRGVGMRDRWTFDFVLFKQAAAPAKEGGDRTAILGTSTHSRFYSRSVNLEIDLPAGEYVVHVRLDRQVRLDDAETLKEYWDDRKLSRVLTERAKSQSIASNAKITDGLKNIPVPLDSLGGNSLTALETVARDAAQRLEDAAAKDVAPTPLVKTVTKTTTTTTTKTTAEGETKETIVVVEVVETKDEDDAGKDVSATKLVEHLVAPTAGSEHENVEDTIKTLEDIYKTDAEKEAEKKEQKTKEKEEKEAKEKEEQETEEKVKHDTIFLGLSVYYKTSSVSAAEGGSSGRVVTLSGQLRHEMNVSFDGLAAKAATDS